MPKFMLLGLVGLMLARPEHCSTLRVSPKWLSSVPSLVSDACILSWGLWTFCLHAAPMACRSCVRSRSAERQCSRGRGKSQLYLCIENQLCLNSRLSVKTGAPCSVGPAEAEAMRSAANLVFAHFLKNHLLGFVLANFLVSMYALWACLTKVR